MATPWIIRRRIDLAESERSTEYLGIIAYTGANAAHSVILRVFSEGQPVDMAASTIMAYFLRNGEKVVVKGSAEGNVVKALFPAAAYAVQTRVSVLICVETADEKVPIFAGVFDVKMGSAKVVIDPDDVIPDVTEIVAQIAKVKEATAAAQKAEKDAREGETARVSAEGARVAAEGQRATAEQNRVTAEKGRADAEAARVSAEGARVTAEGQRATAEQNRARAEQGRADAEEARVKAEAARVAAESQRARAEQDRVTAEQGRADAEATRDKAEAARVTAEQSRKSAHDNAITASEAQTERAKAAADKLSNFEVEVESLPPSADPTANVQQTATTTKVALGIPTSNFAYATFYINPETRQLVMRVPNGFSAIQFAIIDRRLVVRINAE